MRNRTVGINVRVTVTEKKKVTMLARKCGLSLSEYIGWEKNTISRP